MGLHFNVSDGNILAMFFCVCSEEEDDKAVRLDHTFAAETNIRDDDEAM